MVARKRQGPNSDSEAMPRGSWRGFDWLHAWWERGLILRPSCWLLVPVTSTRHEYRSSQAQATSPPGPPLATAAVWKAPNYY